MEAISRNMRTRSASMCVGIRIEKRMASIDAIASLGDWRFRPFGTLDGVLVKESEPLQEWRLKLKRAGRGCDVSARKHRPKECEAATFRCFPHQCNGWAAIDALFIRFASIRSRFAGRRGIGTAATRGFGWRIAQQITRGLNSVNQKLGWSDSVAVCPQELLLIRMTAAFVPAICCAGAATGAVLTRKAVRGTVRRRCLMDRKNARQRERNRQNQEPECPLPQRPIADRFSD